MRKRLILISAGAIVALALISAGAGTTSGAKTASACPTQTSKDALGRTWSWRVVTQGSVSCAEAIRTNLAYIRAAREGRCPSRICTEVTFPGGWLCSSLSAAEEKELGNGLASGCKRRGASFKVYKASSPTSTPGVLHLREFLSPDRKVWCVVEDRGCGTEPEPPTRSAEIDSHGNVRICSVQRLIVPPGGHVPLGCFQNWNKNAPILRSGQSDLYNGIRCTSALNGITCTVVAGVGKGKGFRVNKDEAVRVG
jgi:hypothetical protein